MKVVRQGKRILICEDFLEVGVIPARTLYSSFDSSFVAVFLTDQVHRESSGGP